VSILLTILNCLYAARSFVSGLAKIWHQQTDLIFSLLRPACVARNIHVAAMRCKHWIVRSGAAQPNKSMSSEWGARANRTLHVKCEIWVVARYGNGPGEAARHCRTPATGWRSKMSVNYFKPPRVGPGWRWGASRVRRQRAVVANFPIDPPFGFSNSISHFIPHINMLTFSWFN
jgi:hypothetical protein